ncbi:hypothetical protein U0070_002023, partial [Myodes glareolus]
LPQNPHSSLALSPQAKHTTHPKRELKAVVFFRPTDPSPDHTSDPLREEGEIPAARPGNPVYKNDSSSPLASLFDHRMVPRSPGGGKKR